MKKKLLIAVVFVAAVLTTKAQFSGNLQYTRAGGLNTGGLNFIYLFGQEKLKIGPQIGASKLFVKGTGVSIDYGLQGRYYLMGDSEDGGIYPELDILGGRVNSANRWGLGLGAGFTLGSGVDFGVRWETGISPWGGNATTFRLGVFF